ncbi:MAG: hypothetical protein Q7V01_13695, partial [Vicinamibacterales bacterium]|nr:hypothetical protein [Vicinamibacterales bacterium]
GGARHANMMALTASHVSRAEIEAMLAWLNAPGASRTGDRYVAPADRRATILAYERDGKAMTGAEGLIQLIVGPDEYAGRYSHWVSEIEVVK